MASDQKIKNVIIKKVLTRGLGLFFGLAIKKSVGNLVENICKTKIDFISRIDPITSDQKNRKNVIIKEVLTRGLDFFSVWLLKNLSVIR